jgi:predicted DNA-binding protein (MmcQ/YjbR family)
MAARRMTLAAVQAHCEEQANSILTTPFGPTPLVYKIGGRMFALLGRLDGVEIVSLKCAPERSAMLRATYPAITGGYHLNKDHWNTIRLDGTVPPPLIRELVGHAYELVSRMRPSRRPARPRRARSS